MFRPNWVNNNRGFNRGRGGQNWRGGNQRGGGRGGNWNNNRWGYRDNKDPVIKDASVLITDDWHKLETLEFSELEKVACKAPPEPENLMECGSLLPYGAAFDRVSPKNPLPLKRFENRQHFTATSSDDPILRELASKEAGNVYATDTILGVLMAATRSGSPWDLLIRKEGSTLWFDKRVGSKIDFLTVNENWNEVQQADKDSVNFPLNLSREATLINHNFSQQVVGEQASAIEINYEHPNPFLSGLDKGMEPAAGAYRYRRFILDKELGITLVVRTSVSGFVARNDKQLLLAVRALNEFDSKLSGNVDWRQKLETQHGAVFATEMKNNSSKLARWSAESLLAGVHEVRIGFVSRKNTKDNLKHEILYSKRYDPLALAQQMNLRVTHMWGMVRKMVTLVLDQDEDGLYLLLKDPNKAQLHLYKVPDNTFDAENESADSFPTS
jgi:translation initiation factor 3 subunit D